MLLILLIQQLLELQGKELLALTPTVTLLLAVEVMVTPEFANLSCLLEAYEEPIVVPAFQGIHGIIKR